MKQLYSTGVPVPFDCAFACKVKDATTVEKALHLAFGMTRINPNREFFKLEPERVVAVLQLLKVDDITQQFEQTIESDIPSVDKQSALAFKRSMRPPMNFHELGIPNGSIRFPKTRHINASLSAKRKLTSTVMLLLSPQPLARCLDLQTTIRFSRHLIGVQWKDRQGNLRGISQWPSRKLTQHFTGTV